MAGNYGANQYKQMHVNTASRGQVLIMLYEAAIKHTRKAAEYINKKDLPKKGEHIGKAHDILAELCNTLDHTVAPHISQDLERLYQFMIEQMIKANMENNEALLLNNVKLLESMLGAWKVAVDAYQKAQGGKPPVTK